MSELATEFGAGLGTKLGTEQPRRLSVIARAAVDDGVTPVADVTAARAAVADLLDALGRDTASAGLAETPRRVVDTLIELLNPQEFVATTFPNTEQYRELVLVKRIPFHSLCEHHLLPFRGVATIGYLPGERLLGLSKIARVLEYFSRDLQLQERLTQQVADWFETELRPRGVGVVVEAEHLCMSLRGAQAAGAVTTTAAFHGELEHAGTHRAQFGLDG